MAKQFSEDYQIPVPELTNPADILAPSNPNYNPNADVMNPTKPGAIQMPLPGAGMPPGGDPLARLNNFLDNSPAQVVSPSVRTKAKTYGAGMDHHQFERYYNLPRVYNKLGFSPFRDNETLYNENSNFIDEFGRASTQWANLSGIGAMDALTFGSLQDTETAKEFEKAMAIGSSSKEGAGAFINNLYLNSGYTMGILGEAALEEVALALITVGTAGLASEATIPTMIARGLSAGNKIMDGYNAGKNVVRTLDAIKDANKARQYFKQALKHTADFVNPLENTVDFIQGMDKLGNMTNMAKTTNGFANFYRDVRNVRLAWGEAGLEGGMVENDVAKQLLQEHLDANGGRPPTEEEAGAIRETAIKAGTTTGWQNVGAIYFSNKIVFDNFFKTFKPVKNLTNDVLEAGIHGKILRTGQEVDPFKYVENTWKNSLNSLKDPKTYARTGLTYFKANIAEGLQETAQEIIGGAAEDYYINEWRGTPVKGGYFASITDNLQKQVSAQGFETFMSGFLMGGLIQPVTKAPNYIKNTYKKFKNPEQYQLQKQYKEDYINKTVNQLNELWNNTGKALQPDLDNLVAQDSYAKGMAEATAKGDAKTYYDLKDASYYNHVHTALKMNRLDTFIERMEDQKNLTPEEVAGMGTGMSQGEYFGYLDKAIANAKGIQQRYDNVTQKLKNPFNPQLGPLEAANSAGWEEAQKKAVFMQYSFDRYLGRMNSIMEEAQKDTELAKVPQNEFNTLFQTESMDDELELLNSEIESLAGATGESGKLLKNKKRKQKLLSDFNDKMKALRSEDGVIDLSDKKVRRNANKAKTSYKNYLKFLAEVNKTYAFNEALDGSFEKLLDYYALDQETGELNKAINTILDPNSFLKVASKEARLAQLRQENLPNEFRESLEAFIKAKETNDLMQLIFDEGMYFDPNDLEAMIKDGTKPTAFYYVETGKEVSPEDYNKAMAIVKDYAADVLDIEIKEPAISDEVSDAEYRAFVDTGMVSPERIKSIADKVKAGTPLSVEETAIYSANAKSIEEELRTIREADEETPADLIKVTRKDSLANHPELAVQVLDLYKTTNANRIEDDNDPLDPDYMNKSDEALLNSIQFKNFFKTFNSVQRLIDDYNTSTGRVQDPAAEPIKVGDTAIMSTAMRNKLTELGYKPGDFNLVQAQAIIDRGLTKEDAEKTDAAADMIREEVLTQAKGTMREEINKLISSANTIDELKLAEEEVARMLDDTVAGTGRTGWDSSGYTATDLDALIKVRKDELAFSFTADDIYPGMTVIMKNNEKLVIDEIKGDTIYGHKANDITKLRKIKKSTVQDKIKFIFKTDMMDEDVVAPTEQTVTPEDNTKSNESQKTVTTSERDAVSKDWLESDTEDVDIDPNC